MRTIPDFLISLVHVEYLYVIYFFLVIFINHKNQKVASFSKYILIVCPFLIYCTFVMLYSLNLPSWDDYGAILVFLNNFEKAQFTDRIVHLFAQHNEHRILSSRMIYAAYYLIFGSINFKAIIAINIVLLALIFLICIYFIKKFIPNHWQLAAIVLSICLFDINNFENANGAMCGIQNYGIILLFLGSMLFYSFNHRACIIPAVLLQIIGIYSSGNGILAAFFIVVYNIFSGRKLNIIVSAGIFLVFVPLYFFDYRFLKSADGVLFEANPIFMLFLIARYSLHIIGSHFSYEFGIIGGTLILLALLTSLPSDKKFRVKPNSLPLLCFVGFAIGSVIIIALFRGNLSAIFSYSSRYFVYSHLLVSLTFVFLADKLQNKSNWQQIVSTIIAFLTLIYGYNYSFGKRGFENQHSDLINNKYLYSDSVSARMITEDACNSKIYCIEQERRKILSDKKPIYRLSRLF